MKRTLILLSAVISILLIGCLALAFWGYRQIKTSAWAQGETWVYVRHGDEAQTVIEQLSQCGNTDDGWFRMACRLYRLESKLQGASAGAYRITKGMSAASVVCKITRHQQDPVKLTFIGTRSLEELAGKIASELAADSVSVLAAMTDSGFLSDCQCDKANVGSIFLPDTYEVYWSITPQKLMQRLLAEYKRFWNEERMRKAADMNLTPQQACILCSIAEEETANRAERGVVARLYWNRYRRNMPLQADPTVKYALGDFGLRRILNVHLKVESPYNTYLHGGLPPGPIRIVEKATIDALLNSKPHNYLYMCAKEDFSGLHNFATNLVEHQRNAALYHRALSKRGIK